MTKKEFITLYVLLSESTRSCMTPTEELIKDAINAWSLVQEIKDE